MALDQNREILAARQRIAEAKGLLRQAGVRPVPTLTANVASGRPLGTPGEEEYSVGVAQSLETAGKRSKRITAAEAGLRVAEAELAERARQLAFDIKTRYIEVAANQLKAGAIARIVDVNRESYRLIVARVQRDDAAPLERQLVLVELNRAEAQRTIVTEQTEAARLALRQLAGGEPQPGRIAFDAQAIVPALEEIRRQAVENRPDLHLARHVEAQSAAELALSGAQSRPDVTASAQFTRRHAQFEDPLRTTASGAPLTLQDRDNILSVGVSIPLQGRRRNEGNIEAAEARARAARFRREHLDVTIPLEAESAWRRCQAAKTALDILSGGVLEESRRNLSVIRRAYDLGQLRLLDVLNEQRRLLETELSVVDAQAELARAAAELERVVGGKLR